MDRLALLLGTVWLIGGSIFLAARTNEFKKLPPQLKEWIAEIKKISSKHRTNIYELEFLIISATF